MSTSWTDKDMEAAMATVTRRAATDVEFRKLALKDAAAAVKAATGKELPAGYTLRFVDNANASATIVLPDLVSQNAELSDQALDKVAGGLCGTYSGMTYTSHAGQAPGAYGVIDPYKGDLA